MNKQMRTQPIPNFSKTLQKSLDRSDIVVFTGLHEFYTTQFFQEILSWTTDIPLVEMECSMVTAGGVCIDYTNQEQIYLLDIRKAELEKGHKNIALHTKGLNGKILILSNHEMNVEILEKVSTLVPTNFMLQDLRFEDKELRKLLDGQEINPSECDDIFSMTDGDAALVLNILAKHKSARGINLVCAKKELIRGFTWLLEKGFHNEELKWISILRYFDTFNLYDVDQLWSDELNHISIVRRLANLGVVTYLDWDTCKCSTPFKQSLERLAYLLCNKDEKRKQEKLAVEYLQKAKSWKEALYIVSKSEDLDLFQNVMHEILSKVDVVSDPGAINTCYDLVRNRENDKTPEVLLLSILHEHYVGQSASKWRFARKLSDMWEQCQNRSESFLTTSAMLVVSSCLQQGRFVEAEEFLQRVQKEMDFEDDGNLAQIELLTAYLCGIMNLDTMNPQRMKKMKHRIMSHTNSRVWLFFMRIFFEEDLFLLLFTPDEYEHFLDKILSEKSVGLLDDQGLIQQIYYYLFCNRMRYYSSDSDDQSVVLTHKIEIGNSDHAKLWGYYALAKGESLRNELNMAGAHIDEMLYYVSIMGCLAMRFRGLLLGTRIAVENNQLERAEGLLMEAKAIKTYCQWDSYSALVLQEEAQLYFYQGQQEKALECANAALSIRKKIGSDLGLMEALIRTSLLQESMGCAGESCAAEHLLEAASIARRTNQTALLERYLEVHPQLSRLIDQDCLKDEDCVSTLDSNVRIRLFSECQICCGNLVLHEEQWPTRKVKGIFQYLLLHSDQRIARNSLAKEFWPEITDNAQGLANLRVALSLLGKTLGVVGLEHMLKRNRQRAWLEIPEDAHIDYFDFREKYESGKECYKQRDYRNAKKHFSASLKVLEEPFLSTQVKDEWAVKEKAKVAKKKERCQYYLLHMALANQQYANAVVYCKKMLEENRYREDIYCILIKTLRKQGRVGEALSIYKSYKKILNEDLKLNPSKDMLVMEKKLANTVYLKG